MTPSITNTAGEFECEVRSRRSNALEALGIATGVMALLWPFCFAWGVLDDHAAIRRVAQWPLVGLFFWVFVISPFWHRDSLESLGLGNPIRLWRMLSQRRGWPRWRLLSAIILIFGALFLLSMANWPDTARMFKLGDDARLWPLTNTGLVKLTVFSFFVSAFVVTCVVRYDNFTSAFRIALIVSAVLIVYAGVAAVLNRGWEAFATIDLERYPLDVLAYVFWGGLQQFVFTAYFSTRLRKGFAPDRQTTNAVANEKRLRATILGGLIAAFTIAPALWLTIKGLYGAQAVSLTLLFCFAAFGFPVGAIWTHFYCKDRRRLLVATLAGSFFGLIHVDSYGLVMVTFALGTVLAYVFMEDRFRNLSALGFIHGFLGSTFGKLFKGEAAGALQVDYHVGPWNVDEPTVWVLVIPLLCLAGYAATLIWVSRRPASFFVDTEEQSSATHASTVEPPAIEQTAVAAQPPSPVR